MQQVTACDTRRPFDSDSPIIDKVQRVVWRSTLLASLHCRPSACVVLPRRFMRTISPDEATTGKQTTASTTSTPSRQTTMAQATTGAAAPTEALAFCDFVNVAPTPFHAVAEGVKMLEAAGFVRLKEGHSWETSEPRVKRGGKYYVTRNASSIVAFAVGEAYKPGNGFSIVGCHTDSPCFKIRPVSKADKSGFASVACETYGGGLFHTWLDRDLGIAGRVVVSDSSTSKSDSGYTSHLVNIARPVIRIPTIAIHLERTQNETFKYNLETEMVPIIGMVDKTLNAPVPTTATAAQPTNPLDLSAHHQPMLLSLLATSLSEITGKTIEPQQIHDFDLSLYDVQPSVVGGALNEYIFSARLDNLFSSFAALTGLAQGTASASSLSSQEDVKMIALWDNEEIGSVSAYGAMSNFLESILHRVASTLAVEGEVKDHTVVHTTLANSYLLSCDMGHSIHPGYPQKHQANHAPLINAGPAIKTNANQRYASTAQTIFLLRRVAALAEPAVPLQEYEVRNDMGCGSTIGPLVSRLGIRTVDIGCPQLSMHSVRETGGSKDIGSLIRLFETFFRHFRAVDRSFVTAET
ncbi:uncharacterized protein L969DRAFT_94311 [Mixia osmundae IAM 14324]|uniref:uncharacterized protein n=1 Tax=Mixia osmundae (strain CBS 9802 / IAM 14324 / JCM 22182 / KY 12970) TaxID=764103 RepID=UPI0004A54886|nr:uncharacterized protein L969DRAFT_94311 [Mixia osmundae IAM 14324]KEI39236.1 hypothetical protein L969DRAFT_94311 [Mixia osmundae IAM 14324]